MTRYCSVARETHGQIFWVEVRTGSEAQMVLGMQCELAQHRQSCRSGRGGQRDCRPVYGRALIDSCRRSSSLSAKRFVVPGVETGASALARQVHGLAQELKQHIA